MYQTIEWVLNPHLLVQKLIRSGFFLLKIWKVWSAVLCFEWMIWLYRLYVDCRVWIYIYVDENQYQLEPNRNEDDHQIFKYRTEWFCHDGKINILPIRPQMIQENIFTNHIPVTFALKVTISTVHSNTKWQDLNWFGPKKNATMCVEWNGTTSCSSRASSHSQREQNTLKCIYVEEQQNRMQRIMKSIAIPIKYEQTRTMALISLWYDLYTQCRTDTGIYTFECIGFGKKIVIGGDAERFHV